MGQGREPAAGDTALYPPALPDHSVRRRRAGPVNHAGRRSAVGALIYAGVSGFSDRPHNFGDANTLGAGRGCFRFPPDAGLESMM
jgi:hypothetical protein